MLSGGCLLMLWADQVIPAGGRYAVPCRGVHVRAEHLAPRALAWTLLDLHRQGVVRLDASPDETVRQQVSTFKSVPRPAVVATVMQWPERQGFDAAVLRGLAAIWQRPLVHALTDFVEPSSHPANAVLDLLSSEGGASGLAAGDGRDWYWNCGDVVETWPAFVELQSYWQAFEATNPMLASWLVTDCERAIDNTNPMTGMSYGGTGNFGGGGGDFGGGF